MKTTALTLSALAVLAGLAACSKENFNSSSSDPQDGNTVKVTLSANQDSNITRAAIGETTDGKTAVLWSEDDALSVFDGANANKKFSIKDGVGTTSGTFEGEVGKTSDSYVALYPYQEAASINTDRNTISGVTLSSTQTATAGTFDPTAALMTAVEGEGTLSFKNAVGYIKVTPTFACTEITLTSNNSSDALAGTVSISIAADGTPTASIAADASNSVSIEGDIKANTTYYIAALPLTLTDGFKLIFTDSEGNDSYRESSKSLEIKRNTITDLGSIGASDLSGTPYVTFSASSEQKFKMKLPGTSLLTDIGTFEYSVGRADWKPVVTNEEVTFGGGKGDLRLRGISSIGTAGYNNNDNERSVISFTDSTVPVAASGDIRTLINWTQYETAETKDARFQCLFYDCKVLTSAPNLPSTSIATLCYYNMFKGCTSLKNAPALPAEALADECYAYMFLGCTSLETAPALPAGTLAAYCYQGMFNGCTSLENLPSSLPSANLTMKCYYEMFRGCTSLTSIPENLLPATNLADYCYSGMFYGCTGLCSVPENLLQARTAAPRCYANMFYNCSSLKNAPALPASTLAEYCYYSMFQNCSSLEKAPELPAKTLEYGCYQYIFYNCTLIDEVTIKATALASGVSFSEALYCWLRNAASSGTIHKRSELSLSLNSHYGIPSGWSAENNVTD